MNIALIRQALPRAIFHTALGLVIVICLYSLPRLVFLIPMSVFCVVFLTVDLLRFRLPALKSLFSKCFAYFLRPREDVRLTGASYFLVGCLVSILAFPGDIAIAAVLFLALGDPAAAIVKRLKGTVHGKIMAGNLACLLINLVVAAMIIIFSGKPSSGVVFSGAVSAAIIQALPIPINDNLTIPIGSGLIMLVVNAIII